MGIQSELAQFREMTTMVDQERALTASASSLSWAPPQFTRSA